MALNEDDLPIDDAYKEQFERREAEAFENNSNAISLTNIHYETPEEAAQKRATTVDTTLEGLSRSATQAEKLPALREKLSTDIKEPSIRGALNSVLNTVTGGVLTLDEIDKHLQAGVTGEESELAKKLESPEVLKLLDPAGNMLEALTREQLQREGTLSPELQNKVSDTVGMLASVLAPSTTGKRGAKAATTLFTNSLFSNPSTHVANIASNAITSLWAVPERFFAASWAAAEYAATLGSHERKVFFGEAGAMLFGALHSSLDAIVAMGKALRTGDTRLSSIGQEFKIGGTKYAEKHVDKDLLTEGVVQQGNNFLWTVATLPVRALIAEDVGAKVINHEMEKYALIYRKLAEADRLSKSAIQRELRKPNVRLNQRAEEFATAHTFQRNLEDLGPVFGAVGSALGKIQGINLGAVPVGRLIVPILRTPMNLAHFTLERSPGLNLLSSTWRSDVAAGGALRATAMGKVAGGALIASSTVYMAHAGLITGGGPADPNLRRQMIENGWLPYSLHIGDKYYQINRLGPIGALLGISADYAEIGGAMSPERASKTGQAIGLGVSRYVTSNGFLKDVSDALAAAGGDQTALTRLVSGGIVSEITPGAIRAIRKSYDPVKREVNPGAPLEPGIFSELRTHLNTVKMETPGWSTTLPPQRNLWGDANMLPSGFGPDMISPVYQSFAKHDPAGDEIIRLGKKGLPIPGRVGRTILGKDPESRPVDQPTGPLDSGIALTDLEYDEYVRLAGNELKSDGVGMHDKLNQIVDSENYKKASDEKRSLIIMNVVNVYRNAAEKQLLKNNPGILETYETQQRIMGRAITTPRSVVGPQRYQLGTPQGGNP